AREEPSVGEGDALKARKTPTTGRRGSHTETRRRPRGRKGLPYHSAGALEPGRGLEPLASSLRVSCSASPPIPAPRGSVRTGRNPLNRPGRLNAGHPPDD